jgi:hypothetical protein
MYLYKKLMTYWKNKFAPRWYPVTSFCTTPEKDGTYLIFFSIAEGDVHKGYTKKCPPLDAKPEELVVMVRKFHEGRVMYRVFWKLKE